VVSIAATARASISALRFIPALTASGQLVGHLSSVRIPPALILPVRLIGCASDSPQTRAHIVVSASEPPRQSRGRAPRPRRGARPSTGADWSVAMEKQQHPRRAAVLPPTTGRRFRRPGHFRRLSRCPSRELSDWHCRPHRHLAQRKSKMDEWHSCGDTRGRCRLRWTKPSQRRVRGRC
jgi:hypothetical protein